MMNRENLAEVMDRVVVEIEELRNAGQKEYARVEENAFNNFERVQTFLGVNRQQVLLTYAIKHLDGICSFVQGHRSQRESVKGRIFDLIVYLIILLAMILEDEGWKPGESITKGWKDQPEPAPAEEPETNAWGLVEPEPGIDEKPVAWVHGPTLSTPIYRTDQVGVDVAKPVGERSANIELTKVHPNGFTLKQAMENAERPDLHPKFKGRFSSTVTDSNELARRMAGLEREDT